MVQTQEGPEDKFTSGRVTIKPPEFVRASAAQAREAVEALAALIRRPESTKAVRREAA